MLESCVPTPPSTVGAIDRDTKAVGFTMASDLWTGALLRTLAASKPRGSFLEMGTGTGLATAWLLDGMDVGSTLLSIDNDEAVVAIARRHLADDARVTFVVADGGSYLSTLLTEGRTFDFVFADSWPGKYTHLDEALRLVKVGGLYIVDDMLPQPNWPPEHPAKVARLVETLSSHPDLRVTPLSWSTGLMVAVKVR